MSMDVFAKWFLFSFVLNSERVNIMYLLTHTQTWFKRSLTMVTTKRLTSRLDYCCFVSKLFPICAFWTWTPALCWKSAMFFFHQGVWSTPKANEKKLNATFKVSFFVWYLVSHCFLTNSIIKNQLLSWNCNKWTVLFVCLFVCLFVLWAGLEINSTTIKVSW